MPGVDWRFPTFLIAAMLLGLGLTYLQMRAYNNELNRALHASRGEHLMLVSGRGRSFLGGAIVIAIVDITKREIVFARAMTGATVFQRFADVPELLGRMDGAAERVRGKQLKLAVQMATAQVKPPQPSLAADQAPPQLPEVAPAAAASSSRLVRKHDKAVRKPASPSSATAG